jgi:hypothetical protein
MCGFGTIYSLVANTPQYQLFAANSALTSSYSVTNSTQFSAFANIYEEFRVLGCEMNIAPVYTATVDTQPVVMFPRREPSDTVDSSLTIQEVCAYQGMKFANLTAPTKMAVKMSGSPESSWASTDIINNVPIVHTGIGLWTDYTIDVYAQLTWRVQFRGVKATGALRSGFKAVSLPQELADATFIASDQQAPAPASRRPTNPSSGMLVGLRRQVP